MIVETRLYCDECHLRISEGMRYVRFKKPGTSGRKNEDYTHYHARTFDDCWLKQNEKANKIPKEI